MKKTYIRSIKNTSFFKIPPQVEDKVSKILKNVKLKGDKAIFDYTLRFDGVKLTSRTIRIKSTVLRQAWDNTPKEIKRALNKAKQNIKAFHTISMPRAWNKKISNGVSLGQIFRPLETVGIYVPGGTAPLVSTVLMTAIPAQVAGVKKIIMVTPPKPNSYILAAAYISGVTEVYTVGGAQAIGALAYGSKSIPKVDKIFGPGNIYVTAAKKMVFGIVDIDVLAGPSEVVILADNSAKTNFVAADLLSQLEHDPLSKAVLITTSNKLFDEIIPEIKKQAKTLIRKSILKQSITKGLLVLKASSLTEAINGLNTIASEHVELMINNPKKVIPLIKNAGIILIGPYTPVALSDFIAGTNHVLPTGGSARSFPGLSISDYLKPISTVYYSKKALKKDRPFISTFANIEGLDAHKISVQIRG